MTLGPPSAKDIVGFYDVAEELARLGSACMRKTIRIGLRGQGSSVGFREALCGGTSGLNFSRSASRVLGWDLQKDHGWIPGASVGRICARQSSTMSSWLTSYWIGVAMSGADVDWRPRGA
ncbi:hypothetical protein GW17_00049884 [Ensete ventricosum]|nr:hypothetical protein GW17_00049884 [Ensete ventricosum]